MKENTNSAIVLNTAILYIRLIIVAICGLFSSRFALQALGVNDYGIFAVVGSVISFIAIINTIMISTSNRFLAVEIGKGSVRDINEQFNVNLLIQVAVAIFVLLVSFPLGDWYIFHYVNYDGDIATVVRVFNITIIGSVISFIGVPYNGLLMAKERFFVFCITDIIVQVIKVLMCYLLIYYFARKLMVYTITTTILAAVPTLVFAWYCHNRFAKLVRWRIVKNKVKYKSVLGFSIWVGYGAIATVGKTQGAALIVNAFFNTAMNTALGLANTINQLLLNFAHNVSKSISPQITKNYAAGNVEKATSLTCLSSKVSFLFMLFISSPFLISSSFIFELWLGFIPDYLEIFTLLIIIDTLIGSLNAGIPELVFATGNIKWYQIIVNTFLLLSVVVAFFVLKTGAPAYSLLLTYIAFSFIVFIIRQVVLKKVTNVDNKVLAKRSYFPCITVALLYIPFVLWHPILHPIVLNIVSLSYLGILIFLLGLSSSERKYLINAIQTKLHHN